MTEPFRARLAAAVARRGPLCAGLDPSARMLERWGLPDSAVGATEFGLRCVEALAPHAAALKPNVAFFEQYGSAGLGALESVLAAARDAGTLVIADAKRGDIASTNAAYARAWFGEGSGLRVDALTVAPYMGARALRPFVDAAEGVGGGVFVVVRGSNPEGRDVQRAVLPDGRPLEEGLLDGLSERPGTVGAVIGLVPAQPLLPLPEASFYLVPGLGAQGGSEADLARQFSGMASTPIVVNLSRSLTEAGPDPDGLKDAAVRARATIDAGLLTSPA